MKRKSLIIAVLIAVFSAWIIPEASAQRHRYHPRHRYYHGHAPRGYYRSHAYAAPPPRVVVVPGHGYRRSYYHPRRHYRSRYYARPHHYNRGYHRGHYHGRGWR